METNLELARPLLDELSQWTIRLSNTTATEGCRLAKCSTKTGKPLDAILRMMWKHLADKCKNRSSKSFSRLHPVEALVISNWEKLKEAYPKQGDGPEQPSSSGQPGVKAEVQIKVEKKEEPPAAVQKPQVGLPVVVSSCSLNKTATVYIPASGELEQVHLVPGPDGWMVGQTSTGQKVTSTLACEPASGAAAAPAVIEIPEDDEHEENAVADDEPDEQEENAVADDEPDAASDSATLSPSTPGPDVSQEIGRTPSPSHHGLCSQWRTGRLQPGSSEVMDLDASDQEEHDAVVKEVHDDEDDMQLDDESVGVEDELVGVEAQEDQKDMQPDDILAGVGDDTPVEELQGRLLKFIGNVTVKVPSHRIKKKTPASLVRTKLAYKPGVVHIKKEPSEQVMKKSYRVMLYRGKRVVAIRQCKAPRSQVGQISIPGDMSAERAITLAGKVVSVLEDDNSLECYSSDLLCMAIDALQV